jgi:hypothetical protein
MTHLTAEGLAVIVHFLDCRFVTHCPLTDVYLTESWECSSFVYHNDANHVRDERGINTRQAFCCAPYHIESQCGMVRGCRLVLKL